MPQPLALSTPRFRRRASASGRTKSSSLQGTPTSPTPKAARKELERVPGATGLVEDEGFADIFAQSIGDVLELTPGVFADTSAQRESRISVRGSGLNSSFERRGLTVLREGVRRLLPSSDLARDLAVEAP